MRTLFTAFCILWMTGRTESQNVLNLTIQNCEEMFLRNNSFLLAEQYNISAKQALIIQSKLYPNPVMSAEVNAYDPQNKKVFHVDSGGQKAFQLEQVILLGGKRKTEIEIAKSDAALAEAEYADLLRSLRLELYRTFYSINGQRVVISNYTRQLAILDTIIASYKTQTDKGNLPLKDLIRLKAVYIKLSSNKAELSAELNESQKKIKILLRVAEDILPVVPDDDFQKFLSLREMAELKDIALQNRPDLKIAEMQSSLSGLLLQREKKKRIPDLAVNGSYDQRGGAFRNQINVGVSMPLPLLNTNKGNIRAAEFDSRAMEVYAGEKRREVELDVEQAWLNIGRTSAEYRKVREFYNEEFTEVFKGMNDNFQRRNVTILEFVDFVESYNESFSEFEKVKKNLAESAAIVNYITASNIY